MIFDFDGVVVDSEPIHMAGFQQVLATLGITLTKDAYYSHYLGYDDHDCLLAVASDENVELAEHRIRQLIEMKTKLVQKAFAESIEALPGSAELIHAAGEAGLPLAICSGALREEIRLAARTVGVLDRFAVIVAAEDVRRGKPDPEGYRKALAHLSESTGRSLSPERTVVVEDSPAGIASGQSAGMKVLAVTTSYPSQAVGAADLVVPRLTDVSLDDVRAMVG
jgi:HAD superfamily hydrolase (TIGR01509 family)